MAHPPKVLSVGMMPGLMLSREEVGETAQVGYPRCRDCGETTDDRLETRTKRRAIKSDCVEANVGSKKTGGE